MVHYVFKLTHLVDVHRPQQHEEGLPKGEDEENGHGSHLYEGLYDVLEHDHVYPDHGLLAEEEDEVDPAEEDAGRPELPLPPREAVQPETIT